jgi:hypothetical protein
MRLKVGLLALLVGFLLGLGTATAATGAARFTYDAPIVGRLNVQDFRVTSASPAQLIGAHEGSASPPGDVRGTSTTPLARSVATNTAKVSDDIVWPENYGFDGKGTTTLRPGARIDRYGPETGRFTSPKGVPIEGRAMHSSSDLSDYHVYEVVKPVAVEVGPVRPWFGQPGWGAGGVQYRLPQSVGSLCDAGVLRRC